MQFTICGAFTVLLDLGKSDRGEQCLKSVLIKRLLPSRRTGPATCLPGQTATELARKPTNDGRPYGS
jgi:hypothetical protein